MVNAAACSMSTGVKDRDAKMGRYFVKLHSKGTPQISNEETITSELFIDWHEAMANINKDGFVFELCQGACSNT